MCLLYVYVIRQGPNQYPSCALTWTRTSLEHAPPEVEVGEHYKKMINPCALS
jgi:hypothetical protein